MEFAKWVCDEMCFRDGESVGLPRITKAEKNKRAEVMRGVMEKDVGALVPK